jgi:hypothetical protein
MSRTSSMSSTREDPLADGREQSHPSASSARRRASSSLPEQNATTQDRFGRSRVTDAGRIYLEAVLDRYLWLPGTPKRTRRNDRRLARTLYERGVPLAVVRAALVLGAARRAFRGESGSPLPPIRTLHFFLPIVEELLEQPVDTGYAEYLESKLLPLADAKAETLRSRR